MTAAAEHGKQSATDNLTPKQLHFARCVASGMTQSDAYREAYNCKTAKPKTINEKASQLMRREDIRSRVNRLVKLREAAIIRSSLSDRERVLEKLRDLMDTATPAHSAQIRAAELLGKAAGLFKDTPDDDDNLAGKSAAEIEAQLQARLVQLVGDDIDGEYERIDAQTDDDNA